MHQDSKRSSIYLIGRSLLPSALEGALCICFGIFLTIVHLVLLSMALGTLFPTFLDGEWDVLYTNIVVQPLLAASNNLTFSNALNVGLWGLLGLAVYFVFEAVFNFFKDWRQEESSIQIADNRIIHHPARKSFLIMVLWRIGVLFASLVVPILAQPLLSRFFVNNAQLALGELSLVAVASRLIYEIVGWMAIGHGIVVFLRLFLMRTRLFGDPDIA